MRKIDFNQRMLDFKGQDIQKAPPDEGPADLRYVCCSALVSSFNGTGQEKYERMALALKLKQSSINPLPLTELEIARIKDVVGGAFNAPEIVHAAWSALDNSPPDAVPTKKKKK